MFKNTNNVLGEGVYGCVVLGDFTISNCTINHKKYNNMIEKYLDIKIKNGEVTKFILDENDFKKELKNTLIANHIDKGKASNLVSGYSILNINDLKDKLKFNSLSKRIDGCKNLSANVQNMSNEELYQISFEKEGITLENLYEKYPKMRLRELLALFKNLLYALVLYNHNGFIHNDIKYDNIIFIKNYNNMQNKMVFIDYGLAMFSNEFNLDYLPYQRYLNLYTLPEFIAYTIIKSKDQDDNPDELLDIFKKKYFDLISVNYKGDNKNFYNKIDINHDNDLNVLFNHMYKMSTEDLNHFVNNSKKYIDIYKLCFVILNIIKVYNFTDIFHNEIEKLEHILLPCLNVNPIHRPDINDVFKKYKNLLNEINNARI
jgi:serine/threonine protein kinase